MRSKLADVDQHIGSFVVLRISVTSMACVQCAPFGVGTYVGSGGLIVREPACREDGGSIPPTPFRSLGQFVTHFACVFWNRH